MSSTLQATERDGAEVVHGAEDCMKHSSELLAELGFPTGVLPLKDLEECGRVKSTGFVWMKQKAPYQHFFPGSNTLVSYAAEVTAYVEKGKMARMTGVKSKQLLVWVPIVEMSVNEEEEVPAGKKKKMKKMYFKTPVGIGRSFPVTAFMTEEEKKDYLEKFNDE